MTRTRNALIALGVGLLAAAAGGERGARATVPGANGRIAFVSSRDGNFEVYSMNADGTDERNLTRNASSDSGPAWSPDGERIAFASNRDGPWRIYVMRGDGSEPRAVSAGPWDRDPTWSPDGTQILFHRSLDTGSYVYAVPVNGGAERRLARANVEIRASWSPDGGTIAYTSALTWPWRIVLIDANGSGERQLPTAGEAFAPDWSPDGQRIAFASSRHGNADVFTIGRDGGGEVRLTTSADNETRPSWSPDGTKLAYVTFSGSIKVVGVDGTGETTLTTEASSFLGTPDWQPATDLSLTASGPARGLRGRRLRYVVKIANTSPRAATGIRLQLRVSSGARLVSIQLSRGSCSGGACALGALDARAETRVTVVVVPRRAGALVVRAAATSATPEASSRDNQVALRTTVRR